jgi:hypothetical protein
MRPITSELNSSLKQPEQANANRRRPQVLTALAFLALIVTLLVSSDSHKALAEEADKQKVTGSGRFVNDGAYGSIFGHYSISGTLCTFAFNAQTVDSTGNTKGQFQFEDKTAGIKIHAALTFTSGFYGFAVYGPATYSEGGVSMSGDFNVMVIPLIGDPDYFIVQLTSPYGARIWSGQVTNGNLKIH